MLLCLTLMVQCGTPCDGVRKVSTDASVSPPYPETRQDSVVDDYFGTAVPDPYRWLEDDRSAETENWVARQNAFTFSYLDRIPFRRSVRKRMEELFNYERRTAPRHKAGKYYFFKNDGLQNQDVLYRCDSMGGPLELVVDPNTFSADGTVALSGYSFSRDGRYLAFQIAEGGSDWNSIVVLELKDLQVLSDTVHWVKFSEIAWRGEGFFYSRYPEPENESALSGKNAYHAVYFHRLGTPQDSDEKIYDDPEHPLRNAYVSTTEDERYLVLSTVESTSGNALAVMDLGQDRPSFHWFVQTFDSDYQLVGNTPGELFVQTNASAPNGKVIAIPVTSKDPSQWRTLIPETPERLEGVRWMGGKWIATYVQDASHTVKIHDSAGVLLHTMPFPEPGTVGGFTGEQGDTESYFSFSSFVRPATAYRLDLEDFSQHVVFAPRIAGYDPDAYTTRQFRVTSPDGTSFPVFVTGKTALTSPDAKLPKPCLLYGYGGFDISILPSFSASRIALLEVGGLFVVANIRGGGEFGKEWHQAGTKERKQNVFADFMAAADYLVDEGFTDRGHLAIEGRSNGGLLVGACMTQRPDLCKVAFPGVGVLDMLRYHKFTIGWAWAGDYGTSETKEGYDYLIPYSPLHNLRMANYPATLITTADHDDRVVPAHSFKFAAALQSAQTGTDPALIRIDVQAGHGAGKPTSKRLDEAADMLSFMLFNMQLAPCGMQDKEK
jgi:prolyl oligopeptidase